MNECLQHLQEHLQHLTDPIQRIDVLNQLAFALRHTDTAQSLLNSKEAVAQAERISYVGGLATGLLNQGLIERSGLMDYLYYSHK